MLLLLREEEHLSRFEEKRYLSASSDCFELSSHARASHIQASPLERGGLDAVFLLVMSWLYIDVIFQSAAVNVFTATTRVDMLSSQ